MYNLRKLQYVGVRLIQHRYFADALPRAAHNPASYASSESNLKQATTITEVKISDSAEALKASPIVSTVSTVHDDRSTVSFDDVPGPSTLRYISRIWNFIPLVGSNLTASAVQNMLGAGSQMSWVGGAWLFRKLLDDYGPIVRLHGPFGGDVVILSRPEHVSSLFQNEGPYPIRSNLDSIEKYRLSHRRYKQAGPFVMYGPDWERLRKSLEMPLHSAVVYQAEKIEKSCDDLITRIIPMRNRQDEVSGLFRQELYKWCLECLCTVMLNRRLGFLDTCGISPTSDPGRLLEGLFGATAAVRKLEYGWHFYKLMQTWAWKDLVKNCDMIDSVVSKYVQKTHEDLKNKQNDPSILCETGTVLETLMMKEGIVVDDILTIFLDMMLIGVNATTHTVQYLLYHLAKTPRCQLKLLDEVKQHTIKAKTLKDMPYLQACVKECLRLDPPMPVLSRVLSKDVVIHNYRMPKGTFILIATHLASLREEHFDDAQKFKPERWLGSESNFISKDIETYASIPFGYGAKACIAKELAEMQIALLVAKIVKRFRVEYHYGSFKSSFDKFLSPQKRPLKFRFIDRE